MPRRTLIIAVAVALGLAGCSGELPTTPDPRPGLPVSQQSDREVDRFVAAAEEGDTELEIVQGFLRAAEGFASDTDVSRTYLTSELASAWVPTSTVSIYEGETTLTRTGPGEVTVEVQTVGRLDADGRLTEQSPRTSTHTFELTEVGGEHRISAFPDDASLWLSQLAFERAFRPTTLSYLNTQQDVFVPELRWLADSEGLPTSVTRAQLAPLPPHLEGAVRTAAGEGMRLATPAVPVDPSSLVATVNLQGATLAGDGAADELQSQLAHSLLGLSSVAGVQVQVAGQPLRLEGADGPITGATQLPFSDLEREVGQVLLRVGEQLTVVDPSQYALRDVPESALGDVDLPAVGLEWTGVSATGDLDDLAAVSGDGGSFRRWRGEQVHTNEGIGDRLTAPAVDTNGAFWLGGVHRSSQTPRIWVVDADDLDAVARPVETDWLADQERVHGLSISPDGSRAAVVLGTVESASGEVSHRLVLSGIVRDGQGRPSGLTEPLQLVPHLDEVTSARWRSAGELLLVGQRPEDPAPQPFLLPLGGWLESLGELPGVVDVVPVPRATGAEAIARTEDGGIFVPEGQEGWQPVRNGDQVVVPGG
ncbi:LpqB family beta-propeller domain-containing protein [Serinicoccus kebangsaanensis]|uniref:LpqB family beta-propeller domain-containing protein n=1 Tax=Serinicoccus kebangsaanensis TaxID=2602069 RepID=UPI00124EDCC3|nr:LpqB family beta-propeller domain-containing protein [Serinicoccus kebangsaanensis]